MNDETMCLYIFLKKECSFSGYCETDGIFAVIHLKVFSLSLLSYLLLPFATV